MFSRISSVKQLLFRSVSRVENSVRVRHKSDGVKVVCVGGQSPLQVNLALMLKQSNHFSEICIHDFNTKNLKGICADLNTIHTPSTVTYHEGIQSLEKALQDANLIIILDKTPSQEENMKTSSPEALETMFFNSNADHCGMVAETYASICPGAIVAVAAQPVNIMTPLVYSLASKLNHNVTANRVVGFTLKDEIQANLLLSKKLQKPINEIKVPLIGGSSRTTIIPLLSTVKEAGKMSQDETKSFIEEVRRESVSRVCCPLSSAAALYRLANALAMASKGQEVYQRGYVACTHAPGCQFFVGKARFGPAGLQTVEPLPPLSDYEDALFHSAIFHLKIDMKRANEFVKSYLLDR
ncbi:probable malate dehydrogenase, mitochondrial [Nilaparvata lugens]|uniref:probable malate dehydrogenase, mitochondrial n=1 Tax=Nilaparvata lugens TaxID=108931 RepID=UPI00193E915F|nr:probable malate dehydrogenase, mitochondrial [Nilaparvata lugens]